MEFKIYFKNSNLNDVLVMICGIYVCMWLYIHIPIILKICRKIKRIFNELP